MLDDLRFGWRILLKNRGTTAVACLSLALGIGAATAMFSVIDAVLLNPFPYRAADRIVGLELVPLWLRNIWRFAGSRSYSRTALPIPGRISR
jgi:hypothetical protein